MKKANTITNASDEAFPSEKGNPHISDIRHLSDLVWEQSLSSVFEKGKYTQNR